MSEAGPVWGLGNPKMADAAIREPGLAPSFGEPNERQLQVVYELLSGMRNALENSVTVDWIVLARNIASAVICNASGEDVFKNAATQEPSGKSPGTALTGWHRQKAPRGAPVRDVPAAAAPTTRLDAFMGQYGLKYCRDKRLLAFTRMLEKENAKIKADMAELWDMVCPKCALTFSKLKKDAAQQVGLAGESCGQIQSATPAVAAFPPYECPQYEPRMDSDLCANCGGMQSEHSEAAVEGCRHAWTRRRDGRQCSKCGAVEFGSDCY